MKSLKRRYNNIAEQNPRLRSICCFYQAIIGQNFSRKIIRHWFYKLIEKDDYQKSDLKDILTELEALSKMADEGTKPGVVADLRPAKPRVRYIPRLAPQAASFSNSVPTKICLK